MQAPETDRGDTPQPDNLPPTRLSNVLSGSRPSSRAASPAPGHDAEDEGYVQLAGRMEEHRCDPALRVALERLDAVRKKQPNVDDFTLDRYLNHDGSNLSAANITEAILDEAAAAPSMGGNLRSFSTDLLLEAARRRPGQGPLNWLAGSRSTSPGSTNQSSQSGSVGSFSGSARYPSGTSTPADGLPSGRAVGRPRLPRAHDGGHGRLPGQFSRANENLRDPAPPPGAPPRRPVRQRVLSARARRVEAAGEAAAADLGMYTAR